MQFKNNNKGEATTLVSKYTNAIQEQQYRGSSSSKYLLASIQMQSKNNNIGEVTRVSKYTNAI